MATLATLQLDILANTAALHRDVEKVNGTLTRLESGAGMVGKALAGAFTVTAIVAAGLWFARFRLQEARPWQYSLHFQL